MKSEKAMHLLPNICREPDGTFRQFDWAPSTKVYTDIEIFDDFFEHVIKVSFVHITDRSTLSDFLGSMMDEKEIQTIETKIKKYFGVNVEIKSDYIVNILGAIEHALKNIKGGSHEPTKQ